MSIGFILKNKDVMVKTTKVVSTVKREKDTYNNTGPNYNPHQEIGNYGSNNHHAALNYTHGE